MLISICEWLADFHSFGISATCYFCRGHAMRVWIRLEINWGYCPLEENNSSNNNCYGKGLDSHSWVLKLDYVLINYISAMISTQLCATLLSRKKTKTATLFQPSKATKESLSSSGAAFERLEGLQWNDMWKSVLENTTKDWRNMYKVSGFAKMHLKLWMLRFCFSFKTNYQCGKLPN